MRSRDTDYGSNDSATMRTPIAWKNRDLYLYRPPSIYQSQPRLNHHHQLLPIHPHVHPHSHSHSHPHPHRTSSPSVTTTSSDDREEVPIVRHPSRKTTNGSIYGYTFKGRQSQKHNPRNAFPRNSIISYGPGQPRSNYQANRNATLRSTRSFPGLMMAPNTTWDDKPCPIHGHSNHTLEPISSLVPQPVTFCPIQTLPSSMTPLPHQFSTIPSPSSYVPVKRFNSTSDVRRLNVLPIVGYNGDGVKSMTTKLPLPPYMNGIATPVPMPIYTRPVMIETAVDTFKRNNNCQIIVPDNRIEKVNAYQSETVCCKGHLIVLWIILGVVTMGVIAGIILGITAN